MSEVTKHDIMEEFRKGRKEACRRNLWGRITVRFKVGAWEGMTHAIAAPASSMYLSELKKPTFFDVVSAEWLIKPKAARGRVAASASTK